MPYTPIITSIPVERVIDLQDRPDPQHQHVHHLADSIQELSQMRPIIVQHRTETDDYALHDGAHRLLAARSKGLDSIVAQVFPEDTPAQHLRRCILESEFLTRSDSWAIQAMKLRELKTIHEACYPHTRKGHYPRGEKSEQHTIPAFVAYLAQQACEGKTKFADLLKYAKHLDDTLLQKIDAFGLPQSIARDLCRLPTPEIRTACVEELGRMKSSEGPGRKPNLKVATALHHLKQQERAALAHGVRVSSTDVQIIRCRMESYTGIPTQSIDAIITDPLYHHEHLSLYGDAAKMSAAVLKDGGFAAFYCGKIYLDQVMALLGEHLQFRSLMTLRHKQYFGNVGSTQIAADCKYILVYQTKGLARSFNVSLKGIIDGSGQEKGNHEFQQAVSDLDNVIEAISNPGDTILDMFAGSGTTGVAAILKSRKTILLEEDQADCDECHRRLGEALAQRDHARLMDMHPSSPDALDQRDERMLA